MPLLKWLRRLLPLFAFLMIAWSMSDGWPFAIAVFRNMFWIVLALLHLTIGVPLATHYAVKAMRRADPDWAEEQVVEFDESGVRLTSASRRFELAWSELRRVVETNDVWLMFVGGARLVFLPLRVPREAGVLEELRGLVESKFGRPFDLPSR